MRIVCFNPIANLDNFSQLYTSSEYTDKVGDYHEKDSPFKWRNFEKCALSAYEQGLFPVQSINKVCEVGCGAGGILACLTKSNLFPSLTQVDGWDINPGAIAIAKSKYDHINFYCQDLFASDSVYDLVLCADVFEHVENPYLFLRNLRKTAKYFLFNIPLESNLLAMLQGKRIVRKAFNSVGHLHFYTASTAELILEVTGYRVLSKRFAFDRTGNLHAYSSLKKTIAAAPQFVIEKLSPYLSSLLMGDHLVVLASNSDELF